MKSISRRLVLLFLLATLPLLGAIVLVLDRFAEVQGHTQDIAMLSSTRALTAAIDNEIEKHIAVAHALSTSLALRRGDLAAFHGQASNAAADLNSWIMLLNVEGQQLFNTLEKYGEKLPRTSLLETHQLALETNKPQISGITLGAIAKSFVAAVFVPIALDDGTRFNLALALRPGNFYEILKKQNIPDGWLAAVIDREGKFIARTRQHDEFVGKFASSGWRSVALNADEGLFQNISLENEPLNSAFKNSTLSGWSISVAGTQKVLSAPISQSLWVVLIGTGGAGLLSIFFALYAARPIIAATGALVTASFRLQQGESIKVERTGVNEVDQALRAFEMASNEISVRARRQRVLFDEVNHRVKNTLTLVQAIASLSSRSAKNVTDFTETFTKRLVALGKTHNLLSGHHWESIPLSDVISSEIDIFQDEKKWRIISGGPVIKLTAGQALALGMAIHELTTNSVKYGALSVAHGRLEISWCIIEASPQRVRLEWRETDGPAVLAPKTEGFGSRLIAMSIQKELEGNIETRYLPNGFQCNIEFPFPSVDAKHNTSEPRGKKYRELS